VRRLVVVENPKAWDLQIPGAEMVSAKTYLTDVRYSQLRDAAVSNLCRTSGYQTLGYYVSLLATARGHRPLPTVETIQDLRLSPVIRILSEDLESLIQRNLRPLQSDDFVLSIYFGRNLAQRYERLSRALFHLFPSPLLRAAFAREEERWKVQSIRPIAINEIPETHRDFVAESASKYFARTRPVRSSKQEYRYDLAILYDPADEDAPSDERAIRKFVKAAQELSLEATLIGREDYTQIAEFDALFIREVTSVDHHTYRMARRAVAEGLVVIDDPESIVRCTNKVFQAELFARHAIPTPQTMVVHEENLAEVAARVGFPCVLKKPDSSFSQGVVKIETLEELRQHLEQDFADSHLAVAQRYVPSDFDWRIGVLGGTPLYACKYHMARGHWQIVGQDRRGRRRYGKVEAFPLHRIPRPLLELARASARWIGNGFYGVDIKEIDGRFLVIEVNDNPNVDTGCEDQGSGDNLYRAVMRFFREQLDARGQNRA